MEDTERELKVGDKVLVLGVVTGTPQLDPTRARVVIHTADGRTLEREFLKADLEVLPEELPKVEGSIVMTSAHYEYILLRENEWIQLGGMLQTLVERDNQWLIQQGFTVVLDRGRA